MEGKEIILSHAWASGIDLSTIIFSAVSVYVRTHTYSNQYSTEDLKRIVCTLSEISMHSSFILSEI
jgi:hypothetical protein